MSALSQVPDDIVAAYDVWRSRSVLRMSIARILTHKRLMIILTLTKILLNPTPGVSYFRCLQNHVIIITSRSLTDTHSRSYLYITSVDSGLFHINVHRKSYTLSVLIIAIISCLLLKRSFILAAFTIISCFLSVCNPSSWVQGLLPQYEVVRIYSHLMR